MISGANGSALPVVELRVHGVSGTPPEKMLDDPFPEAVAGDDVARFLRAAKPVRAGTRVRAVEAFHWGRFTSGGASRALWLLLIPFTLLNLSRYTLLRPTKVSDAVLRLLGAVLTSTLVANVTYVALELFVRQCAAVERCRAGNSWLGFLEDWPFGAMLLLGGVPSVVVIGLLWWFGRQTFLYEPLGSNHSWSSAAGSLGDYAFWHTPAGTRMLRDVHVAVACIVTGLLYSGALRTPVVSGAPGWLAVSAIVAGVVLLGLALLAVVWPSVGHGAKLKWVSVVYFGVSAGLSAGFLWKGAAGDGGIEATLSGFEAVWNLHLVAAVLLLLWLLGCCRRARRSVRGMELMSVDAAFRPFWNGYGALILATFATVLAAGLSGGLAYRVVDLLAVPVVDIPTEHAVPSVPAGYQIELSTGYLTAAMWGALGVAFLLAVPALVALMARQRWWTVALFLAGTLLGATAMVLAWMPEPGVWFGFAVGFAAAAYGAGAWSFTLAWRRDGIHSLVQNDYPEPAAADTTTRKIALQWRLAAMKYRYHWVLGALAGFGGTLLLINGTVAAMRLVWPAWREQRPPWLAGWLDTTAAVELSEVGSWVVSGLVLALAVIGVRTWQGGKMRTTVGIVWDLIGFWPRAAHPICPPPYGGRATIELTSRAKHLVHHDHMPAVVLSGHSQGSVVCAATVLLLHNESLRVDDKGRYISQDEARETLDHLSFVSYGSQLQWAFSRLFPHYLGYAELDRVRTALDDRWYNVYRWTDPLGGPVLSWPYNTTPCPSPAADVRGWRTMGPDSSFGEFHGCPDRWGLRLGHDIRLRDAEFVHPAPEVPSSPVRGHSGYYEDPVFDEVVAHSAVPPASPPLPQQNVEGPPS